MADNLTTFACGLSLNMGALNSWNSQGVSMPVGLDRDSFLYLYLYPYLNMKILCG
jgi:hypothetical protein